MNWQVNDLLYERKRIPSKPDVLEYQGWVAELRNNEHGATTKAVIRTSTKRKGKVVEFDWERHVVVLPTVVLLALPKRVKEFLNANEDLLAIRANLGGGDAVQFWSNKHGGVVHQVIRSEEAGELQFNTKFPESGFYIRPEGTGNGDGFFTTDGDPEQRVELALDADVEAIY